MYILQQLIRTRGIGYDGWALPLLQFPPMDSLSVSMYWNDSLLDHYCAMLMVLLHSKCFDVSSYGNLLLAGSLTPNVETQEWTVLDDEEERNDLNRSLNEDDIIALFEQFPHQRAFESIFRHRDIFQCCSVLKVYARAKYILKVLCTAMTSYTGYKNLVKILGRSITCLLVVASSFVLEHSNDADSEGSNPQSYFDDLVTEGIVNLMRSEEQGLQLNLSSVPYSKISYHIVACILF